MLARYAVFVCVGVLVACSPKASELGDPVAASGSPTTAGSGPAAVVDALADANAPPADGRERFYGRESFTIISQLTGTEAGTVTEHVRDWGRLRTEITRTTMKVGGMSIEKDTRLIVEGSKNTTVDNKTGMITTMGNPFYDTFVAAMKGKSPTEFGEQFMRQMGGQKTNEKAAIAGEECEYWTLMSVKTCVTAWGATLHTATSMGGITIDRKATEVRMGDGGPDSAFAYDASKAQAQPNVQDILRSRPGNN